MAKAPTMPTDVTSLPGDTAAPAAAITGVAIEPRVVRVSWSDGRSSTFHHIWLRDNAPELRHESTNHRVVETSTIPVDVRPTAAVVDDVGNLVITWAHDGHVSTFTPRWLSTYDYSNGVRREPRPPVLWDASIGDALTRASYPDITADDAARLAFLRGFRDHGLAILHDVPNIPGTVLEVAELLGEVRVTSWGRLFDVVSMDDANSVAYTSLPLVTHTDEGYRDPAPSIQLQHFLRADAEGGEATLVDGFRVASDLRAARPDLFELLVTVPLHFHFRDATAEHENDAPVIELDRRGELRTVRYSNHSAQPFLIDPELMEPYYEAYRAFGTMRESDQYRLQLDLRAGDMYIVDNRRVLHGRTGFTKGGARHLQSCYIERDELISRLTVLERASR